MNNCNMIFAFRVFCFNSRMLTLDIQWCAIQGAVSRISDIEGVHAHPGEMKKQPFEFCLQKYYSIVQGVGKYAGNQLSVPFCLEKF